MNSEQIFRKSASGGARQMLKLLIIGCIILALLIPAVWIGFVIHDRDQRQQGVVDEIAGKWGGTQIVSGPFVCVPYGPAAKNLASFANQSGGYLYLAPDSLKITGKIKTVAHKRGIFKVTGYQADLELEAGFAPFATDDPAYLNLPLRWDDALIAFDLDDQRGLKELRGDLNGQDLAFNRYPGLLSLAILPDPHALKRSNPSRRGDRGQSKELSFKLAAKIPAANRDSALALQLKTKITGTRQLYFASSALQESVTLSGDWPDPSFAGDMLPESRNVDGKGFTAFWRSHDLNSGLKKLWTSDEPALELSELGVNFLVPIDSYRQSTRALKYSVLFLVLTFMTFFFAEVKTRQRIHPIQYLMVGAGLLVFYLLLLSLSEYLAFGWAYLIAAAGVILQISLYCHSILKTRGFALQIGALLCFLYCYLYVLLRLQDSALLIGSVSLFVLLSVVMYITRKINWYNQE